MKSIKKLITLVTLFVISSQSYSQKHQDFSQLSKDVLALIQHIEKTPLQEDSLVQLTYLGLQKALENNLELKKSKLNNLSKTRIYQIRKSKNDAIIKGRIFEDEEIETYDFDPIYLYKENLTYYNHSIQSETEEELEYKTLKVYFYNGKNYFYTECMLIHNGEEYVPLFINVPVKLLAKPIIKKDPKKTEKGKNLNYF